MYTFVLVIHVIVSILLMVVILLQDGKGGDVVSALGGGSQTVFGSTGATTFLTKATVALTVIFAITSLSLAVLKTRQRKSILESVNPKTVIEQTQAVQPEKKVKSPSASEEKNTVSDKTENKTEYKVNDKAVKQEAETKTTDNKDKVTKEETKTEKGTEKSKK